MRGTILSPTLQYDNGFIYVFGGWDGYKYNKLRFRYKTKPIVDYKWIKLDDMHESSAYPLIVPYTNKIIEK